MAGNTGRRRGRDVQPRQGKPRRAVVKRCRSKIHRRVASGAIPYRKCGSRSRVRRRVGSLPGRQVTA
jgi:hypothetical protein